MNKIDKVREMLYTTTIKINDSLVDGVKKELPKDPKDLFSDEVVNKLISNVEMLKHFYTNEIEPYKDKKKIKKIEFFDFFSWRVIFDMIA